MIDKLLKFLGLEQELPEQQCSAERIRHATAVLLVEIARADHDLREEEMAEIRDQLAGQFDIEAAQAADLLGRARKTSDDSVSLYEFTRILHAEMSYAEKESVIAMLWRIALADRDLDKYEDYMIGKIAELLYVARGDVLRLKQRVIESLGM